MPKIELGRRFAYPRIIADGLKAVNSRPDHQRMGGVRADGKVRLWGLECKHFAKGLHQTGNIPRMFTLVRHHG